MYSIATATYVTVWKNGKKIRKILSLFLGYTYKNSNVSISQFPEVLSIFWMLADSADTFYHIIPTAFSSTLLFLEI